MWRRASWASASNTLAVSSNDGARPAAGTAERLAPTLIVVDPRGRDRGGARRRRPSRSLDCGPKGWLLLALLRAALGLGEDVAAREDQQILPVDGDLGAAVFRVHDLIADRDVDRDQLAGLLRALARADGENLALLGLLLGRVGDDESADSRLLGLGGPDDDPVLQRLQLHRCASSAGGAGADRPGSQGRALWPRTSYGCVVSTRKGRVLTVNVAVAVPTGKRAATRVRSGLRETQIRIGPGREWRGPVDEEPAVGDPGD